MTATGVDVVTEAMAPGNTVGNLRARLWATLTPCLPGRVFAYAPAQVAASVAPALWIAGHDGSRAQPVHVVTFTVWAVADGASHAAQAMLDELTAAVAAAVYAPGPFNVDGWSSETLDVDVDVAVPAVRFDVSGTLSAVTFCPPIPYQALVPPEVITP
jgi:hypothetical protein